MNFNVKINNKEHFIPLKLLEQIVSESDIKKLTIEEEQSELYFDTYNGSGKIYFKNGNVYEGYVKYGILNSVEDPNKAPGILKFNNGTIYEGDIKDNTITGVGKYIFNTGAT